MKYYFAPLEGVSGYLYRKAHHEFFPHIDKYFIPFFAPKENSNFSNKERKELDHDNHGGAYTVPQLLTNKAEPFVRTAKEIQNLGYEEVNLNLGCPSGTVVAKGKGAGFLADLEDLQFFLDNIFSNLDIKVSIKTRLGLTEEEEFYKLLEIYNQYPVHELIIHPRVREDYYKGTIRMHMFEEAKKISKNPICYNGDLFTVEDIRIMQKKHEDLNSIMIGRGLISNPGLVEEAVTGEQMTFERFQAFYNRIYQDHCGALYGEKNILFHMKELWSYMICMFRDSSKDYKKICKSQNLKKYDAAVNEMFRKERYIENGGFVPPHVRN